LAGGVERWHGVVVDDRIGRVIEVNEPQVWTLIGVFAASTFTMMGLVSTLFLSVINAKFDGLRGEIGGLRSEMNAGFAGVDARIDHLDRDVNALFRRVFPEFPDAS
jgi:hypothetical protein